MSKITMALATGAFAALAFAAPANAVAATGSTAGIAASTADAPAACVSATYDNPTGPYQDVYVNNTCPTTQRVKVLWAYATDSACHAIAAGGTYKDHHLNQNGIDRWDGIEAC
jgi:hypothetical protein